jgi:hypothetical protein
MCKQERSDMNRIENIKKLSDDQLKELFDKGLLGNICQALGLSGRGTWKQLIGRIRKELNK